MSIVFVLCDYAVVAYLFLVRRKPGYTLATNSDLTPMIEIDLSEAREAVKPLYEAEIALLVCFCWRSHPPYRVAASRRSAKG